MKTKLLKIVRKRYQIIDNPKGFRYPHHNNPNPHFYLNDKQSHFSSRYYGYEPGEFGTKQVVLEEVMKHLKQKIRKDYWSKVKGKKSNNKAVTVWYK